MKGFPQDVPRLWLWYHCNIPNGNITWITETCTMTTTRKFNTYTRNHNTRWNAPKLWAILFIFVKNTVQMSMKEEHGHATASKSKPRWWSSYPNVKWAPHHDSALAQEIISIAVVGELRFWPSNLLQKFCIVKCSLFTLAPTKPRNISRTQVVEMVLG